MNKDNGMLWSCLIEILWQENQSWLLATLVWCACYGNFEFNLPVNILYFLSNWLNLLGIFTTCEKLKHLKEIQAFEAAIWCLHQ